MFNLQKYFLDRGEDAYVFTCGSYDPRYPNTLRTRGGDRVFYALSPFYYLKKINKMKFDILCMSLESGMTLAPLLSSHRRPKIVTALHTEYLTESTATRTLMFGGKSIAKPSLEEWIIKYFFVPVKFVGVYLDILVSDKIVAVSKKTKEDYLKHRLISKEKVSVIYNGVDSDKFSLKISGDSIRAKYSLGDSPVILVVGSGIILKGIIFVFFALKKIMNVIPNAKLMVVGIDAKFKERMISLITNLKIQSNVILIDRIPNHELPSYYSASDVVAIPSLQENFPVVILEAMSSGKPIVASRVGGIPEVIVDGENGLLVEPGNVNQIADALLHLLADSSIRKKIGIANRNIIMEKFDWKKIGGQYFNEFEKLI